ncbi:CerR family C-terminal domain-containing protein [Tabrizicola sp.]|uniref:CerR family C-terminal domain-containing protein n=1 Tax=Tabrizicola sp. TaxID=2005166 RepID=UPI0035B46582
MTESPLPPPEGTRRALIDAGLRLFGQQGFAATPVRQLATEAGANIAAIAYHFGNKDGLRLACAEEFGRRMAAAMLAASGATVGTATEARAELKRLVRGMMAFLLGSSGASEIVPFMLRELAEGGPGIDAVYTGFAEPTHRRLCALWGLATGTDPEADATRLAVFTLIGQLMYFRIGRDIVARRMGWATVDAAGIAQIADRITRNLDAMLDTDGGP